MKKVLKQLLIILFGGVFILSGCSPTNNEMKTRTFTDDLGRVVELPKEIESFIPSGSTAQTVLFSVAPDKMLGVSSKFTDAQKPYIDSKYHNLPVFGQFYGKNVSMNKEEIIAAAPDVIIDLGQVKKDMKTDLDKLQEDLGVPVVFIEANLDNMDIAYEKVGEVLNMQEEVKPFVVYCREVLTIAAQAKAKITQEVSVYYGEMENGLQTTPTESMHAEVLDIVGVKNVADSSFADGKSSGDANLEQVLLWNPNVILFGPEVDVDKILNDSIWQDIDAVKNKQVYQIPDNYLNWFGRPPGVNRYIGILWVGSIVYPEEYNLNMPEEVQKYYKLFYHYDMSETEAKQILDATHK